MTLLGGVLPSSVPLKNRIGTPDRTGVLAAAGSGFSPHAPQASGIGKSGSGTSALSASWRTCSMRLGVAPSWQSTANGIAEVTNVLRLALPAATS